MNTDSSVLFAHSSMYYITLACTGRFEQFTPLRDPSTPGFSSKECQATLYNSTCIFPFRYPIQVLDFSDRMGTGICNLAMLLNFMIMTWLYYTYYWMKNGITFTIQLVWILETHTVLTDFLFWKRQFSKNLLIFNKIDMNQEKLIWKWTIQKKFGIQYTGVGIRIRKLKESIFYIWKGILCCNYIIDEICFKICLFNH